MALEIWSLSFFSCHLVEVKSAILEFSDRDSHANFVLLPDLWVCQKKEASLKRSLSMPFNDFASSFLDDISVAIVFCFSGLFPFPSKGISFQTLPCPCNW